MFAKITKKISLVLLITFSILLSSCACYKRDPQDPFESFNRTTFALNRDLDKRVLIPVATTYKTLIPHPVRTHVTDFYNNLAEVQAVINDFLQVHFAQALSDTGRFLINSSIGVFGIFDVASKAHLPAHYNDFGLTLARWGFRNTPYFVIPFYGPSTVSDGIGMGVNFFTISAYAFINPASLRYSLLGLGLINQRANALDFQSVIQMAEFDPYVFQRNAYLQHRNYLIEQTLKQKPFEILGADDNSQMTNETESTPSE